MNKQYLAEGHALENRTVKNEQLHQGKIISVDEKILRQCAESIGIDGMIKVALERIIKQLPASSAIPIIIRIKNIAETTLNLLAEYDELSKR